MSSGAILAMHGLQLDAAKLSKKQALGQIGIEDRRPMAEPAAKKAKVEAGLVHGCRDGEFGRGSKAIGRV